MKEVEAAIDMTGKADDFRRDIISAVAAFKIDNPEAELVYTTIFPELFMALEANYFDERRSLVERMERNMLRYFLDETEALSAEDIAQVESTLTTMREDYGYCERCAQEVIAHLLQKRYA